MSRARDLANLGDGIDATQITSGVFANGRIQASNVTQHEGSIDALASNPTVTLGSNATFPAKTPVSIYYGGMNTGSINMSAGVAYENSDSISLTPKSSTSQFLVVMSAKCARNSTSSAMYFSFTFGKGGLSTSPVQLVYVTDDPRHNSNTVFMYASPGTSGVNSWTTSDTLYFGTWARSDGTTGYLENYTLTVFEYMAN